MDTYRIEHEDTYWSCTVELYLEKATVPIKEMVDFWSGSDERLEDNNGDYVQAFLKQLASKVHWLVICNNYNLYGVLSAFDKGIEGWCKMDGSQGIKLIHVDDPTLADDQFEVKKIG